MLSEGGRGDANPILLIDENGVTADTQRARGWWTIIHLTSRGISEAEAKRLVLWILRKVTRSILQVLFKKNLWTWLEQSWLLAMISKTIREDFPIFLKREVNDEVLALG